MCDSKFQLKLTKWDHLMVEDRIGHDNTPCNLECQTCKEWLHTEGDFARHYIIPNPLYLNLGYCPNGERGRAIKRELEEAHRTR